MRIAYICADSGVPVFGRKGCSIHVQEVLRAFLRLGATVDLFSTNQGGASPAAFGDVVVHPLTRPGAIDPTRRELAALDGNGELRACLEREGPFDLIYERYSLWSHAGMEYAREADTPGLLEVNAPLIEEQATYRILMDREAAYRVAERAFGAAHAVVAVSAEIAEYLRQFPEAKGRVHVIANGVDPARFSLAAPPVDLSRGDKFTVGFVGSLKPWHGLSTLVEAFALFAAGTRSSRLLVVGDGPERSNLVSDLGRHNLLESTLLTGSVPPESVPRLLAAMNVGVAPYPRLDHFYFSPLKVFEYMMAGLPVVAAAVGQLNQIIEHDENGLLYGPGDVAALAEALERLRGSRFLRERLGKAGRDTVLRQHTWDAVARRLLGLAGPVADGCPGIRESA